MYECRVIGQKLGYDKVSMIFLHYIKLCNCKCLLVITIEKADEDYVLSFCPSVCNCHTLCRELGTYVDDNGNKHLTLSDKILSFRVNYV